MILRQHSASLSYDRRYHHNFNHECTSTAIAIPTNTTTNTNTTNNHNNPNNRNNKIAVTQLLKNTHTTVTQR